MTIGTDALLNPLTADYSGDVAGGLTNAVYLRITTPLGSYWADPALGSKLHLLRREKGLPRVKLLAEQYIRQALQALLDDKRCDRIDVALTELEESAGTVRLAIQVDVYQSGVRVAQFADHIKVMQQ